MDYITNERYAENVDARCSTELHENLLPASILPKLVVEFISLAESLDGCKKALFYGKMGNEERAIVDEMVAKGHKMGLDGISLDRNEIALMHAIIGIATEAGELMEAMLNAFADKQKSTGEGFDHINVREELGDVMWYVQLGLNAIGSNLGECMTINDNKLEKRYGPAFSSDKANNRDLNAEHEELSK